MIHRIYSSIPRSCSYPIPEFPSTQNYFWMILLDKNRRLINTLNTKAGSLDDGGRELSSRKP